MSSIRLPQDRTIPGHGDIILIIDDDPANRDFLHDTLVRKGFTSVVAADGKEGLNLAQKLLPAVITLDIMMPHMDGWQLLAALKLDPDTHDIPIILVTIGGRKNSGVCPERFRISH